MTLTSEMCVEAPAHRARSRRPFELMELRELADTGIALVKYRSQNRQADGSYQTRREALLSLVFALEEGTWRLVYDQNTVIPPAGQWPGVTAKRVDRRRS
jgi:hypothetical protein